MQEDRPGTRPVRILADVFVSEDGPSGIGVVAANAPSASVSSLYEQCFGRPEELYFRSIVHALQLGKDLGADRVRVLCPDETTVRIVNREASLEPGSPLAPFYMRARALMYTYGKAEVRIVSKARVRHARRLAITASRMPARNTDAQFELFALAD